MTLALGVIVVVLSALLPGYDASAQARGGFTTLLQGNTLKGWNIVGDANWEVVDGAVQATTGMGDVPRHAGLGRRLSADRGVLGVRRR